MILLHHTRSVAFKLLQPKEKKAQKKLNFIKALHKLRRIS